MTDAANVQEFPQRARLVFASGSFGKIAQALAKAQKAFPPIPKTKTAKMGSYSYQYADLADVLDAVRGPLADNELALTQPIIQTETGHTVLLTLLIHSSGDQIESSYPLPNPGTTPQEMGSAITYARRYCAQAILGISTEADDDGNAASEPKQAAKKQSGAAKKADAPKQDVPPPDDAWEAAYKQLWDVIKEQKIGSADVAKLATEAFGEASTKKLTTDQLVQLAGKLVFTEVPKPEGSKPDDEEAPF